MKLISLVLALGLSTCNTTGSANLFANGASGGVCAVTVIGTGSHGCDVIVR